MSRAAPACLWVCLALFTLWPRSANASSCVETSLEQKLRGADVVFVGRAVSQTPERDSVFSVERVYKGEVPKRITAHFFGVKYAMLFPPERYLVFGSVEPDTTTPNAPPLLTVETCAGSVGVKYAADALAELGAGYAPGKALVSGKGQHHPGASVTDAGTGTDDAETSAVGAGGTSATTSDADVSPPAIQEAGTASPDAPPTGVRDATAPPRQNSAAVPRDAGGCAGCQVGANGDARARGFLGVALALALASWRRRGK